MPQYLLSVWHDAEYVPDFEGEEAQRVGPKVDAVNAEMQAAGAWVFAGGLHNLASATTVEARGGEVSVTDGPYAETKEMMGGFWVLQLPDLDAALEWAKRATVACERPIEVRPFHGE
jgi:hypothetical protein